MMIIQNDEAKLRTVSTDADPSEVQDLILKLEEEFDHTIKMGTPAIGLAAPQIGILKRVAIIRIGNTKLNLINPKIIQGFGAASFPEEGCLSFPGKQITTTRFQEITIENNGYKYQVNGLLAIACQHEIDHLDGVLIMDRAKK